MRRLISCILLFTFMLTLVSCASREEESKSSAGVFVYDIEEGGSGIKANEYALAASEEDISECVRELLQRMIDGPDGDRTGAAIPAEVSTITFTTGAQTVGVNFDSAFNDVPQLRRLLCEAAVVRTLCQIPDVYAVSFAVEKMPLTDLRGNPIGVLTPDSFTDIDGSTLEGYERSELHLFFADETGKHLVERSETVTYSAETAPDRVVVESIIAGPKSSEVFATVNPSTVINDVMTDNGICYVSLNRDFLNKTTNVSDEVLIYSLVNSLTQLGNVNKVQILIDGRSDARLGEYDLSKLFERNLEMIE